MSKKILLINDMPGYGKVALAAMNPVLWRKGYDVFNLPTALVSNTLNYGKFQILETTDYMKQTLEVWEQLNFRFDAICTGFIVSDAQVEFLAEYGRKQSALGTLIFTDPIMGDNGKLYNSVTDHTVELMRRLISVADYIVPNYTESCYLSNTPYHPEGASLEELYEIIDALRRIGSKSVVITSAIRRDSPDKWVVGYDHVAEKYFAHSFSEVPVRFPGTGDTFSAIMVSEVMKGTGLSHSVRIAMDGVSAMILANKDKNQEYNGIPIETCLELLEDRP